MVTGYFNANTDIPEGAEQDKDIAADLAAAGLEDMLVHFLLLQIPW